MKETVTSPPSNTRHQKDHSGVGKQFFPRGQEDSFFKTNGIQAKLSVGQRGDRYEQQADAMAEKLVSKKANNTPVAQAKAVDKATDEKLDKKEEEQKQEEGNTLQRKPMFESEGEPDVQRSMYPENDEGERVFRSENEASTGNMGKGETIVSIARSKLGKVKAKEGLPGDGGKQLRFGHETLLEIFHLAAPGVWSDDVIKYLGPGLPSWCGIFAVYCIKKAGIDIGTWQMGKGVSAFGKLKQTESPQAGDIGYMDANQHHAIIVKVEGDMVHSIDGNSGLQSEIIENKRPMKAYRGFFTALHNEATAGDVQKKENSGSNSEASPSVENKINASKGRGNPLDNSTRSEMESGFGNDFSGVRVHTGNEAQQMSKDLNAQAFTHGQDIYFDEGKYNPETTSGKHLLAHELTHTVQQTGGVQKMVQKKEAAKADYNANPPSIELPELNVPGAKKKRKGETDKWNLSKIKLVKEHFDKKSGEFNRKKALGGKGQDDVWNEKVPNEVKSAAEKLKDKEWKKGLESEVYFLKHKENNDLKLIGKLETIIENAVNPFWSRTGKSSIFQIDHAVELQAGGKNEIDNLELLESSVNAKSGGIVKGSINEAIDAFVTGENKKGSPDARLKNKGKLKSTFDISFKKTIFKKDPQGPSDNSHFWTYNEITEGTHLKQFIPMGVNERKQAKGTKENKAKKIKENRLIYTSTVGGQVIKEDEFLALNKSKSVITFKKPTWIDAVLNDPNTKSGADVGSFDLDFSLYRDKGNKSFKIPILKMDGVENGGGIPRSKKKGAGGLQQILVGMDLPGLSPITINEAEIVKGKGLVAGGVISSTLPVIKGVELDFSIEGNEIEISKTFTAEEFKVPDPFKINDISLTVFGGTKGFGVKGDVDFEIKNVGTGKIKGSAKTDGNFGIAGAFDFDPKLFKGKVKQAGIKAEYDNQNGWKIEGDLTFAEKAVKGIKSGNIHVEYTNEVLKAEGTAETTIKGVNEVTLRIVFGKDVFEIEGGVKIEKLPGIKEGEGKLKIAKKDNVYDFSGSGTVTPDIPGIDSKVNFEFVNDIFTVDASMQYKRDRLEGKLKLGITNQELIDGVPSGKKSEEYTVFGGGQLSLKITEDLKVTAGVNILPNGEVEVVGRIDLPKRFNLFPAPLPKRKKQLLKVPINIPTPIPIIQIYVLGYLDAEAEIGGGYLSDVFAEVKYNPSHPEEMKITGGMSFNMPAYAEIKAGVEFGVKASLLIASIRGGIDLSAALRLEVPQPILKGTLSWSAANGFELDGIAKIGIMPSLTFRGAFKITGEIDLLVKTLSKSWEWEFASMTLKPDAPFGMEFPFKYNKNTPLNLSFDQIKFTYPSVSQLAGSLKDAVVNEIDSYLG
ncbi:MAG: DUF4157 domain-containing protein [Bacteroidota bacterium]|nr:DUF4157 domain-containing protein [Bacteroidota bacterium]